MRVTQVTVMETSQNRILYLDTLRAIAMLCVVGMHAIAYVQLEGNTFAIVSLVVNTAAVPIFFMCDGFLFAWNCRKSEKTFFYRSYIAKSARRLLIPWVLFSLLYVALRYGFEAVGLLQLHLVYGKSLASVSKSIYASNIAQQLYFLLSLFLIRSISHLSRLLFKLPAAGLVSVFLVYTLLFYTYEDSIKPFFAQGLDPVLHAFWGYQYYLAGLVLAKVHEYLKPNAKILAISAFGALICVNLSFDSSTMMRVVVTYLFMLGIYFVVLGYADTKNKVSRIGSQTMGIYLLHAPILLKCISMICTHLIGHNLPSYLVIVVITFFVSYGFSVVITRIKNLRFIFGQ